MKRPETVQALDDLGRVRLSQHFCMREMLYSEVANFHGIPNIPEDPELAIAAGAKLCALILEPLCRAFGRVIVRSAYRSPEVNEFCSQRLESHGTAYYCMDNEYNRARHIWDRRDASGFLGATATVVIPAYLDEYERTNDPLPLAWWLRDNIADADHILFFPRQCSFNIRWYEGPNAREILLDRVDDEELITRPGMDNFEGDHSHLYPSLAGLPNPR